MKNSIDKFESFLMFKIEETFFLSLITTTLIVFWYANSHNIWYEIDMEKRIES